MVLTGVTEQHTQSLVPACLKCAFGVRAQGTIAHEVPGAPQSRALKKEVYFLHKENNANVSLLLHLAHPRGPLLISLYPRDLLQKA